MMRSGQAAAEYVLVLAAMVLLAAATGFCIVAANRYANRAVTLVQLDYP